MDPEQVIQALVASATTMNEEISQILDELITAEGSPFLLMDIVSQNTNKTVEKAALMYLYKSIKTQYKYLAEEVTEQINERFLAFLNETNFSSDNWLLVSEIAAYIYEHVPDHWMPLFELINAKISTEETHILGLNLLLSTLPYVKPEKAEEIRPYLLETDMAALCEENPASVTLGVRIYAWICNLTKDTVDIAAESQAHIVKLIEIVSAPEAFSDEQFSEIWKAIGELFDFCVLPEEAIVEFATKGIEFASNGENDHLLRVNIFDAIEKVMDCCSSLLESILNVSMDIIESSIEINGAINESEYTQFEKIFFTFPHQDVFPLVQQCISGALESDSVARQAAGLCVFRVLITDAPDCAHKDIETIIEFLNHAIAADEEPILQEAACKVLQYFSDGFQSLNCHSPQFIQPLIQLLVSPNVDLRTPAYAALNDILKNLDSPIPGLFTSIIELIDSIEEDNMPSYIDLIATSITQTDEFDDEMCDGALELIGRIVESENPATIMKAYDLGISILKQDPDQIESINELLLPSIGQFLESLPPIKDPLSEDEKSDAKALIPAIDYITGLIAVLKEDAGELIDAFLPPIIALIGEVPAATNYGLFRAALRCCSRTVKVNEARREELLPIVYKALQVAFSIGKPSLQKTAIACIRKIRYFLPDEQRKEFYDNITTIVMEEQGLYLLISDALKAAGKLITMAGEGIEDYMTIANQIVEGVVNTTLPFLNEKPFIENGARTFIFSPFCEFCTTLIDCSTPATDDICRFLLQFFESDDELDHLNVSGALLATLRSGSASQEVMQEIVEAITKDIGGATDPNLQQNITYFLNLLIQNQPAMLEEVLQIVPSIDGWYTNAIESGRHGYEDLLANIGSLYLTLASTAESFDGDKIAQAIEEFPPYDISECQTMTNNLIKLAQGGVLVGPLAESASLAIARFIVWDDENMEKCGVPKEQVDVLIEFLRQTAAANGSILETLERKYAKMRARYRKIAAVLQ